MEILKVVKLTLSPCLAEILDSGLIALLMTKAQQKLHQMDAGSVTLLLDGCARLEIKPPEQLLSALANLVQNFALTFEASQLPLVLWAFDRLKYTPRCDTRASAIFMTGTKSVTSLQPWRPQSLLRMRIFPSRRKKQSCLAGLEF